MSKQAPKPGELWEWRGSTIGPNGTVVQSRELFVILKLLDVIPKHCEELHTSLKYTTYTCNVMDSDGVISPYLMNLHQCKRVKDQ
jgi:hypothetical protein